MKKYLAVLLAISLSAAALSGCGSKSEPADDHAAEEPVTPAEKDTDQNGTAPEEETENDIFAPCYGTWEVKDYVTAELSDMFSDEMEAFRGKTVTYQADSILVDGQDVDAGDFTYEADGSVYDYDKLTEEYNADLGEWWNNISEVSKVTVTSDTDFFGSCIFLADENTLWLYHDNAFFLARRPEN